MIDGEIIHCAGCGTHVPRRQASRSADGPACPDCIGWTMRAVQFGLLGLLPHRRVPGVGATIAAPEALAEDERHSP